MSRSFYLGLLGLGLVVAPACCRAGAMLWQVTGMEGADDLYAAANRARKASLVPAPPAAAVWQMPRALRTARAIMQWDIWQYLKAWMILTGRASDEKSAVPGYRDLTASGYLSISGLGLPELTGNQ